MNAGQKVQLTVPCIILNYARTNYGGIILSLCKFNQVSDLRRSPRRYREWESYDPRTY